MPAPAPWHFLYFLPLPHGHGSLRPTFPAVRPEAAGPGWFDVAVAVPPAVAVAAGVFRALRLEVVPPLPLAPGVSPGPDSWTFVGGGGGAACGVIVTWK